MPGNCLHWFWNVFLFQEFVVQNVWENNVEAKRNIDECKSCIRPFQLFAVPQVVSAVVRHLCSGYYSYYLCILSVKQFILSSSIPTEHMINKLLIVVLFFVFFSSYFLVFAFFFTQFCHFSGYVWWNKNIWNGILYRGAKKMETYSGGLSIRCILFVYMFLCTADKWRLEVFG